MDFTRITVFCFTASYAVALAFEAVAVWGRMRGWVGGGRRLLILGFTAAGVFSHFAYLVVRAREQTTPLSSPYDWSLLAALVLAAVYLTASLTLKRWAIGLFLLPLVLALIGVSRTASTAPFAPDRASLFWGMTHGWLLLLATVAVSVGFVAGLMYLVQNWRLKHKLPPMTGFRLPSLEWLERAGERSLALSAWLVAGGFISGLVLSTLKNRGVDGYSLWTDPVALALGAMLVWLLVTEGLRFASPDWRRGQSVAYLTIATFLLLAVTLLSVTRFGSVHGTSAGADSGGLEAQHPREIATHAAPRYRHATKADETIRRHSFSANHSTPPARPT